MVYPVSEWLLMALKSGWLAKMVLADCPSQSRFCFVGAENVEFKKKTLTNKTKLNDFKKSDGQNYF